ncbi:MAG: hypothetical protein K0Q59_2790 [Paenibacillus sp.]|nr:hypothetical protein [Paenibacillus sp.]
MLARRMKSFVAGACLIVLSGTLVACSGGTKASENPAVAGNAGKDAPAIRSEATKAPTELTVYYMFAGTDYDSFMQNYGNYIQSKYPNFTFKYITTGKGTTLEEMVATKTDMDLIITTSGNIPKLQDFGLTYDIAALATKYKFDLNRFEPTTLSLLRNSSGGAVVGLPFRINTLGLFYNRDLFNKFAVPYLRDGMTWDQIYDVAKLMTRQESGIQYYGFLMRPIANNLVLSSYSQSVVDPKTHQATLDNDRWKTIFQNYLRFYEIPGYNTNPDLMTSAKPFDLFTKEQTLAIFSQGNSDYPKSGVTVNWDTVTYPADKSLPGTGPQPQPVYFLIPSSSKHKDEAFLSLEVLTSDEVQMSKSKQGSPTVLKSQPIRDAYGSEAPELKGRNAKALNPATYAEAVPVDAYSGQANTPLANAFISVASGSKDMNTALRKANEEANKGIAALLGK